MFLNKYVSDFYLDIIYSKYDNIESLDEVNFKKVYDLLISYNITDLEDIIVNYLELFTLDCGKIKKVLDVIQELIGEDIEKLLNKDRTIINKIIKEAK